MENTEENTEQYTQNNDQELHLEPIRKNYNYSDVGLGQNSAIFMSYFLGWFFLGGLIFYFLSGEDKQVKFNAVQSFVLNLFIVISYFLLMPFLALITFIIKDFGSLISMVILVAYTLFVIYLWINILLKVYSNQAIELPYISNISLKYVSQK